MVRKYGVFNAAEAILIRSIVLPPVCLNHKSESGCKYGDKCNFLHTEAVGLPSKKSKKGGCSRIFLPFCPLASFAKSTVTLVSGPVVVSHV